MGTIDLVGITKSFGATDVLKGIDLRISAGEFCVILGPSGCGKSTLLRLLAGLETATAGTVRIGGRDVAGCEPRERGCAMVFQNYALYPHMSVAENIAYSLRVDRVPKAERRRRAAETAELVQLEDYLDRKPAELSGGQRQRVAMARAIIRSPSVFLFDEPLSNLDAELRVQMRHEIRRIHENVGATSIFVTHDQIEAMTLADRLVILRDGVLQQVGTPSEVYDAPQNLFVARFIGSPSMGTLLGTYQRMSRTVRLSDGQEVPVADRLLRLEDGASVVIGIRPEALSFATDRPTLSGRLRYSEELGSARLHHFEIAGQVVPIISPDKRPLEVGSTIGLTFHSESLHFFDSLSQTRLG